MRSYPIILIIYENWVHSSWIVGCLSSSELLGIGLDLRVVFSKMIGRRFHLACTMNIAPVASPMSWFIEFWATGMCNTGLLSCHQWGLPGPLNLIRHSLKSKVGMKGISEEIILTLSLLVLEWFSLMSSVEQQIVNLHSLDFKTLSNLRTLLIVDFSYLALWDCREIEALHVFSAWALASKHFSAPLRGLLWLGSGSHILHHGHPPSYDGRVKFLLPFSITERGNRLASNDLTLAMGWIASLEVDGLEMK